MKSATLLNTRKNKQTILLIALSFAIILWAGLSIAIAYTVAYFGENVDVFNTSIAIGFALLVLKLAINKSGGKNR